MSLADEIARQALFAARPGQMQRLEELAAEVAKVEAELAAAREAEARWMKVTVMRDGEAIREAKAEAWDEGFEAGIEHAADYYVGDLEMETPTNPYRGTP